MGRRWETSPIRISIMDKHVAIRRDGGLGDVEGERKAKGLEDREEVGAGEEKVNKGQ